MTEPVKGLLSREIPFVEVKAFLARLAVLLEECVSFGTNVFVWCETSNTQQSSYHHASLFLLYRHLLEMVDAVSILVRHGAADPCQPLLRSALEAAMGIEYMLEKDTERRALAYQVAHIHKRIAEHARHDPTTEAGKALQGVFNKDKLFSTIKLPPHASAPAIDKLATVLAMPEYTPVDQEWVRLYREYEKQRRKGMPPWYSLFGGPKSIRQLVYHLKLGAAYETLYSNWSETVHAGGAMLTVAGREKAVRALRHPARAQLVASLGASLTIRISRELLAYYAPEKLTDYRQWYTGNIRDFYRDISSREILKVS